MEDLMNLILSHKEIGAAIITPIVGAAARVSYEKETKYLKKGDVRRYFFAAFFTGYLFYEILTYLDYTKLTAIFGLLGGLICVDVIKILIQDLPNIFRKILSSYSDKINDREDD